MKVNFIIGNEKCCVVRRNGVILNYMGMTFNDADATARGTKAALIACVKGDTSGLNVTGSQKAVNSLFAHIKATPQNFNIIEP